MKEKKRKEQKRLFVAKAKFSAKHSHRVMQKYGKNGDRETNVWLVLEIEWLSIGLFVVPWTHTCAHSHHCLTGAGSVILFTVCQCQWVFSICWVVFFFCFVWTCVELSYRMRYAATAICNAINFMQTIFLISICGQSGWIGAAHRTIAAVLFKNTLSWCQTI